MSAYFRFDPGTSVRACCAIGALLVITAPLFADDLSSQYVAALRERGWHDVVRDYLDRAADDPIATEDFLQRIGYERGVTLAALAKQSGNEQRRLELLQQAVDELLNFAKQHQQAPLHAQALRQAGNFLAELALYTAAKAKKIPEQAEHQRQEQFEKARQLFDQASATLQQVLDDCKQRLQELPKPTDAPRNPNAISPRQQIEGLRAEALFLLAKLDFEKAQTYPAGSQQAGETSRAAAEGFAKLYEDYRDKKIGFYGRLYEGRCLQEAGDFKSALECYEDLIEQPIGAPDFRQLLARAFRRRAECHLAMNEAELAIEECGQWLDDATSKERKQSEWLAVAFYLAKAQVEHAKSLSSGSPAAKRLKTNARRLWREVSRSAGEFQTAARLELSAGGSGNNSRQVVRSFPGAYAAGKSSLEQMNSNQLAARLAQENNPGAVGSLRQQATHHQADALDYFHRALRLADESTALEELNSVRYYLCWLYWDDHRIEDAAVMGKFLAQRYPQSKHAAEAAKVALAAYERLYNRANSSGQPVEGTYESQSLEEMTRLIVSRWPGSPEAATALNLLINMAIREDRVDQAQELLQQLPPENRASAEMSLGSALWTRYLQLSAGSDPDATLEAMRQRAAELLLSGFEALPTASTPSSIEATGALYLIQILLTEGKFDRAIEVLEHKRTGPRTLVHLRSPAANRPGFAEETYKTALRVYLSLVPPRREEARQMMTALEQIAGDGEKAQRRLTNIYVSLGLQLQRQLKELSAAGKMAQAKSVADAFGDLLERVAKRSGTDNWTTRNWIAQTNLQLGQGLSGEAAQRYLTRAEEAYREILSTAERDADFAPSEVAILGARKRWADCLAAQGKYSKAFEQYQEMLTAKPNLLQVQLSAADTLQQWGEKQRDAKIVLRSVRGTLPQSNGKNLVWGWLRLAEKADNAKSKAEKDSDDSVDSRATVARYRQLFFEARFNAAQARYRAAQYSEGAARTEHLRKARQSVDSMKRLYPTLGGPQWKQAFEELSEQIHSTKI